MSLIDHRERLDIALQCLNAAHTAFLSSTGETAENLPPELQDLKNVIGSAFLVAFRLSDQCEEEKADSALATIGNR